MGINHFDATNTTQWHHFSISISSHNSHHAGHAAPSINCFKSLARFFSPRIISSFLRLNINSLISFSPSKHHNASSAISHSRSFDKFETDSRVHRAATLRLDATGAFQNVNNFSCLTETRNSRWDDCCDNKTPGIAYLSLEAILQFQLLKSPQPRPWNRKKRSINRER